MKKIKIKESLYILRESKDIYDVIFTGTRKIKKFAVDSLVKKIIYSLSKPLSEEILYSSLSNFEKPKIDSCLDSLENFGIIRRYDEGNINKRYEKQILFIDELTKSWNETLKLQKKIEDSKIAVFGVGGIGTWIINGLHQMGVGEIRAIDPDKITEDNLNRQLFFNSNDIGKYKVDIIKQKLPDANIKIFKKRISTEESLEEILEGTTFLVNCADDPSVSETTKIIDFYASKKGISYCVAGGYNLHLGMIGPIIVPGETKTFEEFLKKQKEGNSLKNMKIIKKIENPGNLGAIAGAVANIQLMEIFKHIIGKGKHNYNRFSEINFMDFEIDWREF